MDILKEMSEAAARGVAVTILTNADGEPPELRFKWQFQETRDGAIGRYRAAGYDLIVQDCDGDASWWELRRGREVLAKGGTHSCDPLYHFDACLKAAEAALLTEVRRRLGRPA